MTQRWANLYVKSLSRKVTQCSFNVVCFSPDTPSATEDEELSKPGEPDGKQSDEVLLNVIRPDYERPVAPPPMEPLYSPGADGKVQGNSVHLEGPGGSWKVLEGGWLHSRLLRAEGLRCPHTQGVNLFVNSELVVV